MVPATAPAAAAAPGAAPAPAPGAAAAPGAAPAPAPGAAPAPRPFTSDGCSLFPDGTAARPGLWCRCCFEHDVAYWRGGTEAERLGADEALRECVFGRTRDRALADAMFAGVRAGGAPVFPSWYRWAYGWPYGRGYAPVSAAEALQLDDRLRTYSKQHPAGYCAPAGASGRRR